MSNCPETCPNWPVLNEALEKYVGSAERVAKTAAQQDKLFVQLAAADGEPDLVDIVSHTQAATFTVMARRSIAASVEQEKRAEVSTCDGEHCVLAAICIRQAMKAELPH